MGGFLMGKPAKSKSSGTSSSGNYGYGDISAAMSPTLGYTAQGGNALGSLLGFSPPAAGSTASNATAIGGAATASPGAASGKPGAMGNSQNMLYQNGGSVAQDMGDGTAPVAPQVQETPNQLDALTNFSNSTGMQFMRDQGVKALEGSQAGKGMLQSGATGQKLVDFGTKLGSTYLNQYIDRLLDYSKLGLAGAGAITGAGGWSKGTNTGTSTGAKEGALPQIISAASSAAALSDIRMKTDVQLVGWTDEDIPVYDFNYVKGKGFPEGRQRGPMAHEVKHLKPSAFIPNFWRGYNGVDYSKIGRLVI